MSMMKIGCPWRVVKLLVFFQLYDSIFCNTFVFSTIMEWTVPQLQGYGNLLNTFTPSVVAIDLFTDTTAILNLLNLRSIMGCPGGNRSVFTRSFRANRELHWIFLGKKAIIITSKRGTTIFFCHYNFFLGKLKEKLARKARVNTEWVYRIVLMPPWHPIILLKSNEFNMAAVSVKRFICQHCLKCKHCKFNTYPPLIWIMFTSSLVETPFRQLLFLVPLKL